MLEKLGKNLIESFFSVIPVCIIIFIIGLITGIDLNTMVSFTISAVFLIVGIAFFTTGADMSMVVIGDKLGSYIISKGKKYLVLLISFLVGVVITIAEPDLLVLAKQLTSIPDLLIILAVAIGVGIFLLIAVLRIFKKGDYKKIVIASFTIIFILLIFTPNDFITVAFDSGGVTTGAMGVPLIVAFGYGLSKFRIDQDAKNDSFGLCGLSSLGPIIIVLIIGLFFKTDSSAFDLSVFSQNIPFIENILISFGSSFKEVLLSITPIVIIYILLIILSKDNNKQSIFKVIVGLIWTIFGLTIFLTGVQAGFLKMGYLIGNIITSTQIKLILLPIGMLIGYTIIAAEPAITMLNEQISELTQGSISKKLVSFSISVGVCIAILIALVKSFFQIPIVYILVPGYIFACFLTLKSPKLFTAIAFDSGGAASGPMTTSFLLPMCIGATSALNGNIMQDAFGVGALVSLIPILTIQILGIYYNKKLVIKTNNTYDETIIEFGGYNES